MESIALIEKYRPSEVEFRKIKNLETLSQVCTPVLAKTGKDTTRSLAFICQSVRWSLSETIAETNASDSSQGIPETMIAPIPDIRSR